MNASILDFRKEKAAVCYLSKINLKEYIESLPEDYKDYEVQREIVSNVYLDNLVDTILSKNHIPSIVLIAEKYHATKNSLQIESFKILDGLQRTFRLNLIWKTILLFKREIKISTDFLKFSRTALSRKFSEDLQKIDSSTKIFQSVIEYYNTHNKAGFDIEEGFQENYQWVEIWAGLSPEEEVNKMLVLNAGHKPVKLKHQLELIFRNILPRFKEIGIDGFVVIREKEVSSIQFSKKRVVGEFHFSHLISSILSIKEGKSVTTNSTLIQKIQNSEFDTDADNELFSFSFLQQFVEFLVKADKKISREYEDEGIKWFGREVTLVGIFGALGAFANEEKLSKIEGIKKLSQTFPY